MPLETNQILVDINRRIILKRILTFIFLLLIIVIINVLIIANALPRIVNYIKGPYDITLEDIKHINSLKSFDANTQQRSYFKINLMENNYYYAEYFLTSWEWGTHEEKTNKFTPDHNIAFVIFTDLKTKEIYIFHASITDDEVDRSSTNTLKSVNVILNNLSYGEQQFIYEQADIWTKKTKDSLDLTKPSDLYESKLHDFIQKELSNNSINKGVDFGINRSEKDTTLLMIVAILLTEIILLIGLLVSILRAIKPLDSKILNYLTPDQTYLLNSELNLNKFQKFSYKLRMIEVYITESFIIYSPTLLIIPFANIKFYAMMVIKYSRGERNNGNIMIRFTIPNGKIKKGLLKIPSNGDLIYLLDILKEKTNLVNK